MLSKTAFGTELAEYEWLEGMKCACLENLSTTVKISYLPPTFQKSSMKSMAISLHT
jgi:hypothetical protein